MRVKLPASATDCMEREVEVEVVLDVHDIPPLESSLRILIQQSSTSSYLSAKATYFFFLSYRMKHVKMEVEVDG